MSSIRLPARTASTENQHLCGFAVREIPPDMEEKGFDNPFYSLLHSYSEEGQIALMRHLTRVVAQSNLRYGVHT
jgi:hypothetical protein